MRVNDLPDNINRGGNIGIGTNLLHGLLQFILQFLVLGSKIIISVLLSVVFGILEKGSCASGLAPLLLVVAHLMPL